MKKRSKKSAVSIFYKELDPEQREIMLEIERDRKSGKLKDPPRRAADCHSLEDLCHYIFKLAHLDGSYQMLKTEKGIKKWVWFGHDFGDRLVKVVEEVASQIPDKDALEELRLVATRVSKDGVERLRRVFPNAQVRIYTDDDDHNNWELSQANYDPG